MTEDNQDPLDVGDVVDANSPLTGNMMRGKVVAVSGNGMVTAKFPQEKFGRPGEFMVDVPDVTMTGRPEGFTRVRTKRLPEDKVTLYDVLSVPVDEGKRESVGRPTPAAKHAVGGVLKQPTDVWLMEAFVDHFDVAGLSAIEIVLRKWRDSPGSIADLSAIVRAAIRIKNKEHSEQQEVVDDATSGQENHGQPD